VADDWGLVRAHRTTEPSAAGLASLAGSFGASVRVAAVERLFGGVATAVHRVTLVGDDGASDVVLKRFPPGIGNPTAEWAALDVAQRLSVPTPTPLRFDATGAWFGAPAIVMSLLPGRPLLQPPDADAWIGALAQTLAAMHDSAPTEAPDALCRSALWDRWVPDGLPTYAPTRRIVTAVEGLRAREWPQRRFCHCDFHPANVLFTGETFSGVVDWSSGRLAPVLNDVARMRIELALRLDGDAADRFASCYHTLSGRPLNGVEHWDVLAGAVVLEHAAEWLPIYSAFGVEATVADLCERALGFIVTALDRLGL
jgi:aminoglycoside phosphotransferase (APT) family kinase protein